MIPHLKATQSTRGYSKYSRLLKVLEATQSTRGYSKYSRLLKAPTLICVSIITTTLFSPKAVITTTLSIYTTRIPPLSPLTT